MVTVLSNSSKQTTQIQHNHNMIKDSFLSVCEHSYNLITDFLNESDPENELLTSTQEQVRKSYDILFESLNLYKLDELSISYNGGKDCLVLLIIYLAVIYDKYQNESIPRDYKLNALYIKNESMFQEQDDFIKKSAAKYQLNLQPFRDTMKRALHKYLVQNPCIKAVIIGIRRCDPYGKDLHYLQETDPSWPRLMRVNPILEWDYHQIWFFLRHLKIEYCKLYDMGYTSLGGTNNTIKNPDLQDGDGYLPAYLLDDSEKERSSRL
ncbi:Flavin adenine dinucleotide (FAD) synthetase [Komagataella phaffii CBS 7435]|uniref:FAD synthase n=2 Tax=Komagataella phaffii TaxID=460519 RepID=C4QVM9_KOMPG|nr:Flavin adenine dinucleotide (FAD) synthetase [Komagataella phaffii GS115]AOA61481.1 GQ67_02503T0 [Komagataella phaffii]CAH2445960.1 Flavin adenine dinucleotide (FAD) synthetase [Komagataella phaffii CBS 7435]AOA66644.1 GQ68_02744T0 [Komagataella phaffii GS115]CAY67302.1 Flavin adenine dinucleotide (FAD) synthetase [Komagataella phaffii GS115]CCA36407.1 Flavin adenine dinucleotide (FAD) synthetase [Komagataella phaffii CBS 7435]